MPLCHGNDRVFVPWCLCAMVEIVYRQVFLGIFFVLSLSLICFIGVRRAGGDGGGRR